MPTHNELTRKYAKVDQQDRDEAIKALLQHRQGRKFLYWLIQIGEALGAQPYTPQDSLQTAFNCGTINVGNQILSAILEVDREGFMQMLKESDDERYARNRELAGAEPERGTDYGDDA